LDASLLVIPAISLAAALFSSVGHGGASAYIALFALSGFAPEAIRPAALVLNIVVAGLAAARFVRAGRFAWGVFWPFAVAAVPAAFLAGRVSLDASLYEPLLAAVLAAASARYLLWPDIDRQKPTAPLSPGVGLLAGGALGALAGLTGIGGGVFLSPLLVFSGWADPMRAAGIAACFIVVNSAVGLAGRLAAMPELPQALPLWVGAAIVGAWAGSSRSLRRVDGQAMLRALGLVLALASAAIAL
jgi:uncharacterized membrane protein YfcA